MAVEWRHTNRRGGGLSPPAPVEGAKAATTVGSLTTGTAGDARPPDEEPVSKGRCSRHLPLHVAISIVVHPNFGL
jgi:hypothetical protein